jgi:translation initiation factor 2 subunit 2
MSNTTISYSRDFLVNRAYQSLSKIGKKKSKFIEPNIVIKDRKTYITNFDQFCKSINREKNVVKEYIDKETAFSSSLPGDLTQLKIDTSLKQPYVKSILTLYIKSYIVCQECKSSDTEIINKNRSRFIHCNMCKSDRLYN